MTGVRLTRLADEPWGDGSALVRVRVVREDLVGGSVAAPRVAARRCVEFAMLALELRLLGNPSPGPSPGPSPHPSPSTSPYTSPNPNQAAPPPSRSPSTPHRVRRAPPHYPLTTPSPPPRHTLTRHTLALATPSPHHTLTTPSRCSRRTASSCVAARVPCRSPLRTARRLRAGRLAPGMRASDHPIFLLTTGSSLATTPRAMAILATATLTLVAIWPGAACGLSVECRAA